jgi:tRNA(fMet)-specific endonuclease VapC
MTYLLDADWVISFLNGRVEAVQLVKSLADEDLAISIITWEGIYEGLLRRPAPERHIAHLDEFTAKVGVVLLDYDVARRYAMLRSDLRSRGLLIPDNDLWIAASALSHDLTLVSRDQHFRRITGLRLYHAS